MILLLAVLGACKSAPPPEPPPAARAEALERALEQGTVQPAALTRVTLPADWDRCPLARWPELLQGWLAPESSCTLAPEDLRTLAQALTAQDERSLRALALLARLADPLATEICVAHLERRLPANGEHPLAIVVDRTAAHALQSMAEFPGMGRRLEQLARGSKPHGDIEVRVECAIRSLPINRSHGLDFLLAFAKLGTRMPSRGASVPPGTDIAAAQVRALQALAQYAGVPARISVLDAIEERERLVRAIEAALASPS